jgi:integrase
VGKGDDGIRRRKDGRFEARYTAQTATGPKRRSETEAEAKAKRDRALAEAGSPVDAGSMAVGAYLDSWLNDSVRGHVRPSTFYRHESIVRLHIRPALGRLKLAALTPAHVQAIYRAKLDEGLSPSASFLIQRRNATPQQPAHLWTSG